MSLHSLVILVPDSLKAATNKVATALGWQQSSGDTMNMPYEDASGNAWWGCRAQGNDETVAMIDAAKAGIWPDADWDAVGVSEQDRADISAGMIADHKIDDGTVDYAEHIADVAQANGLTATAEAI
jgi:hypothetical protein